MDEVQNTLKERGDRYGDFTDHAVISDGLIEVMRRAPKWDKLPPFMKQALRVIADKIARVLNGDPHYTDNWHDIQGYAKLVEDRCEVKCDTCNQTKGHLDICPKSDLSFSNRLGSVSSRQKRPAWE